MGFIVARAIAAIMLFAAVGAHPYDFYTLMRWIVCGVCAYGAYLEFNGKRVGWAWFYTILAVAFNPIAPVHLRRETWEPIDALAGVALIGSIVVGWMKRSNR